MVIDQKPIDSIKTNLMFSSPVLRGGYRSDHVNNLDIDEVVEVLVPLFSGVVIDRTKKLLGDVE